MATGDRSAYDAVFGRGCYHMCASSFRPITRPRLWWPSVAPVFPAGVIQTPVITQPGVIMLTFNKAPDDLSGFLLKGWQPAVHSQRVIR